MNIITVTTLILSVLIGAFIGARVFEKFEKNSFKTALTFSGAYLFATTLLHLVPELFEIQQNLNTHNHNAEHQCHNHSHTGLFLGAMMLVGFLFQQFLEIFSSGVEHGHLHTDHKLNVFSILLALCVHSFFEGSVLSPGIESLVGHSHNSLLYGVVIHKLPAAFVFFVLLKSQNVKSNRIYLMLLVFALASPLGMLIGFLPIDEKIYLLLYAFVCGNLLQISTTIFIESSPEHKIRWNKIAAILLGVGVAFLTQVL